MADDLDLASLASGPAPTLAPAADVRARGRQRRQRTRALVAGSAALLVLASAGTAISLTRDPSPHSLQIADTPTPTPTAAPDLNPAAYLLTPQDAARVAGGTWDPGSAVSDQGMLLYICPLGESWSAPGISRFLQRGNDGVANFVASLAAGQPRQWVGTFRDAADACPRRAADSEDGRASNAFEVLTGATIPDAVVIRDTYRDCDTCRPSVTLWVVVASDRLLSVASLGEAELPRLAQWLDVVRERLDSPNPNPPSPSPTPTPAYEQPVPDTELSFDDLLQIDRIGPVEVGMGLAQARAAAGQELRQEGDDLGGCVYYAPRSKSPDVSLMVIEGIVSRIDVDEASTTSTQEGIRIGSSEADVKRTYPTTTVSKHHYTDGHYLRVLSENGQTAYLFETDGTKVLNFRSGFVNAVDQVEGCA